MKILTMVARVLLGLMFVVFGLNIFLRFIPSQPMPSEAQSLMGLMMAHGWFAFYAFVEMVGGAFVLFGRYVGIGLILLGAMIVNILLFHLTLAPASIGPGLFAAILEAILLYEYRDSFRSLLSAKG